MLTEVLETRMNRGIYMKNSILKKVATSLALVLGLVLVLASCQLSSNGTGSGDVKIANIAFTYPVSSMNPLHMDASEAMKYAVGMTWDPIVELNENLEFEGVLAESVERLEDGKTFRVTLKDDAKWSDGQEIVADDLIYYVLRVTSPSVANVTMSAYYLFEGFDEETGQVADDATEVAGLVKVDDKTVDFVARSEMSLENFNNNYMRYAFPLPAHVLSEKSAQELATTDWFNNPEVISGPYKPTSVDLSNAITYTRNEQYWQGEPKINSLNIRIVPGSQLLSGLQSGEIDYVQQTTAVFPQEDHNAIQELEGVEAIYADPVTSVFTFINTETVPEENVRQAMLYAIDRQLLLAEFLDGNGEVVDGFLTSISSYFDENLEVIQQDTAKAEELLAKAQEDGWNPNTTYTFKIDSGDQTFQQAANIIVDQWKQVGINAQVQTTPLTQLLADAGNHAFDILSVQYTLPPAAPALDIAWLTGEGNWSNYRSDTVDQLVGEAIIFSGENEEGIAIYNQINALMQTEVPMFNTYVIKPLGAKSERLSAQDPSVFGGFMDLHAWDIN